MSKLAIVSPNKYKYSETFIHGHVRELPFQKFLLHGGYLPKAVSDSLEGPDQSLAYAPWWQGKRSEEEAFKAGLRRFLRREGIDTLLAEYGPSGVAVMNVCRELGLPFAVHFHGYDAYRQDILGEQGRQYPELFDLAYALIVVSEDMRRQIIGLGAMPEKVHLIPYGVDPLMFKQADAAANPPELVGIGRFTGKKAPQLTIKAFASIAEKFPEAQLHLAGEGDLLGECKALTVQLGLDDRILFPGRLRPEQVADLLGRARGFVQHSIRPADGDSEGLPLAVLEAMATGLPVVATRHAGIPDAVRDGSEGLLCPEQDVEAMGENMAKILGDADYAARLGRNGRKRVQTYFTRGRYLGDLAKLLEGLLGK